MNILMNILMALGLLMVLIGNLIPSLKKTENVYIDAVAKILQVVGAVVCLVGIIGTPILVH